MVCFDSCTRFERETERKRIGVLSQSFRKESQAALKISKPSLVWRIVHCMPFALN